MKHCMLMSVLSLLFSLREAGMDVPTDAITVKECADAIMKNFT